MISNATMLLIPTGVPTVPQSDTDRLDRRRLERMAELALQGWKPSEGWIEPPQTTLEPCLECGRLFVYRTGSKLCRTCFRREYKESDR